MDTDAGRSHRAGSDSGGRDVLIVIGRQNTAKKSPQLDGVIRALQERGMAVERFGFDPDGRFRRALPPAMEVEQSAARRRVGAVHNWLWRFASLGLRPFRFAPGRLNRLSKEAVTARLCARSVRRFADGLGPETRIFVLAHSFGGRIAAQLEPMPALRGVVCFGYPFKHPERRREAARTLPLATLDTPFLIIQGRQDAYGGAAEAGRCRMSPCVSVEFVDAGHDYEGAVADEFRTVVERIAGFLQLAGGPPVLGRGIIPPQE
ncbi:alpha/beta family hydrolase [Acidimangrovimonas pyrenivorans]|uniref:Alpha/beta family hydrolase n=1 Tax=Acidimangrovimonas pyrenivorans TaxID=2030798 RepID=A0ABV7AF11_9RHOB